VVFYIAQSHACDAGIVDVVDHFFLDRRFFHDRHGRLHVCGGGGGDTEASAYGAQCEAE